MIGSFEDFSRIQERYLSQGTGIKSTIAHCIQQSLESARRGSITDLTELANFWQETPNLLGMGVLDVFYAHLDLGKAPTTHDPAAGASLAANRAFMSLLGLSKAGNFISDRKEYLGAIIKAWPGIAIFDGILRARYSVQDRRDIQMEFLLFRGSSQPSGSKA
jgi:hypothetical protein